MEVSKGDNGTCETVRVKSDNEGGFVVMNKSDFEARKDKQGLELFEEDGGSDDVDYTKWNKARLSAALKDAGVEFDDDAKKDELVSLAVEHLDK
jgi:hypothetical protein